MLQSEALILDDGTSFLCFGNLRGPNGLLQWELDGRVDHSYLPHCGCFPVLAEIRARFLVSSNIVSSVQQFFVYAVSTIPRT
jgi:hypothetical protein